MPVTTSIENLYRDAHEARAAVAWSLSAVGTAIAAVATGMPAAAALTMMAGSVGMTALRIIQTKQLVEAKIALAGEQFWKLKSSDLDKITSKQPNYMWLGRGFRWTGTHTERAIDLNKRNLEMLMPAPWLLKLLGRPHKFEDVKGEPWIHGIEPQERELFIPWTHSEGNWNIFGTTGAGKTRLYEMLCHQIVSRGDVLIVFDPKYDKDLEQTLRLVCAKSGRPDAFAMFHPAFPSKSVRLDPIANFSRKTEVPSRIADIVSSDPNDNFRAFVWRTLDAITGGILYVGERPSLQKLRFYAESGPEPLVERCLKKFLPTWNPAWENFVDALASQISAKKGGAATKLKTGTARQQAMVQVYHEQVPDDMKVDDLNGIISIAEHSREHYGKMIAGLLPVLTQLTSDPLGELLSPAYEDEADHREILDMEKVIRGKRVLYVATDSLSDSTVGSAIAAILLADLRAVAGARYNYGLEDETRIHILCDEAAELVTPPLISIMNKGRGAGMISYLATQNFSDYIHRFGSEDAARMVVGNGNNRLCLRVVDTKTQQYMVESFGEVNVKSVNASTQQGSESEAMGMEFRSGRSTSVSESAAELFPGYLLGKLPDLHFVAAVSGGKVFKGRIPKLVH